MDAAPPPPAADAAAAGGGGGGGGGDDDDGEPVEYERGDRVVSASYGLEGVVRGVTPEGLVLVRFHDDASSSSSSSSSNSPLPPPPPPPTPTEPTEEEGREPSSGEPPSGEPPSGRQSTDASYDGPRVFALSPEDLSPGSSQGMEALPELSPEELLGTKPVPIDPTLLTGTFEPSGVRYYVQNNREPPERCELMVVIKTGSIHESEEERGIAHMLEHLTFRGAKKAQEEEMMMMGSEEGTNEFNLLHRLEENGIQFGAHQNAYTTFDETCYFLHVPLTTDSSDGVRLDAAGAEEGKKEEGGSLLAQCVKALASLVLRARLTDADVDAERSIVKEEWRSGQGCGQRWSDRYFSELLGGSLYEHRMPIGLLSVIGNVSGDTMRDFYRRRYHPKLMAVVAVGDFEKHLLERRRDAAKNDGATDDGAAKGLGAVVELLREHFGDVGNVHWSQEAAAGVEQQPLELPSEPDKRAAAIFGKAAKCVVMRDPEATYSQASVTWRHRQRPMRTLRDFRRAFVGQVAVSCLNNRLRRIGLQPRPPFSSANVDDGNVVGFTPSPDSSSSSSSSGGGGGSSGSGGGGGSKSSDNGKNTLGVRAVTLSVTGAEGELLDGLVKAWKECVRAMTHGFSDRELEIVRRTYHAQLQTAWLERAQEASASMSEALKDNFLKEYPSPGTRWEIAHENSVLRSIEVDELREYLLDAFGAKKGEDGSEKEDGTKKEDGSALLTFLDEDVLVMIFQPSSRLAALLASTGLPVPSGSIVGAIADRLSAGLSAVLPGLRLTVEAFEPSDTLAAMRSAASRDARAALLPAFEDFARDDHDDPHSAAAILLSTEHPAVSLHKAASSSEEGPTDAAAAAAAATAATAAEGRILSSRSLQLGLHELELSNGMRVVYRVNDYLDDEILMTAQAAGGLSEVSPVARSAHYGHPTAAAKQRAALFSCSYACAAAAEFGKYGLPKEEVMDALSGKRVALSARLGFYSRRLSADCSPADLEVQLRLIHVLFTAAIKPDAARLETGKRLMKDSLRTSGNDPMTYFDQAVDKLTFNAGNNPLLRAASVQDVDTFDADLALRVYTEAFSDPSEWRFVFSGNLEPAHAKRLFEKYLASIPVTPRPPPPMLFPRGGGPKEELPPLGFKFKVPKASAVTPLDVKFTEESATKHVRRRMQEPLSCIEICWPLVLGASSAAAKSPSPTGSSTSSDSASRAHVERLEDCLLLDFGCTILEQRLRDTLRLQMGAIYGVSVGANFEMSPPLDPAEPEAKLTGHLSVHFSCSPAMLQRLEGVVLAEVAALRESGPKASEVLAAVKTTRTHHEETKRTNSYWLSAIASSYNAPRYAGDVAATLAEREDLWEAIASSLEGSSSSSSSSSSSGAGDSSSSSPNSSSSSAIMPPGTSPGSAGVGRMKGVFGKLIPASSQHVTVTLAPKPFLPWKTLGALAGVAGIAAGAYFFARAKGRVWR